LLLKVLSNSPITTNHSLLTTNHSLIYELKTLYIIRLSIFTALLLKGIFVLLAIPGLATLWMAGFADMGASLMVVFNGLKALKNEK